MATRFEVCLRGPDEEHLAAVADAILDEVARVEQLLSRFDPRSEISRIHRTGRSAPVLLDAELNELLVWCEQAFHATSGAFDVTLRTDSTARAQWLGVVFAPSERLLQLSTDGVEFDLGGIGKGYALDRAANLLDEYGIEHALLHGGTSSVVARGTAAGDRPWTVALRDPWDSVSGAARPVEWTLSNAALSCSALESAGSVVVTASATLAEVVSTAVLYAADSENLIKNLSGWGLQRLAVWQSPAASEPLRMLLAS